MINKTSYKCNECGFEWRSPKKEYGNCPDCKSEDISAMNLEQDLVGSRLGIGKRRGGMRTGPPRVCKCNQCGYESPKTPGIPCRNDKCPECGGILCGSD
jgi:predicted Zn-ribbon and HTH transcriptional regulator